MSKKILWLVSVGLGVATLGIGKLVLAKPSSVNDSHPVFAEENSVTSSTTRSEIFESGYIWPTTARLFVRGVGFGHTGIDIATNNRSAFGRPVFAAQAGIVAFAGWGDEIQSGSGNLIIIDHGDGYETRYAHLSKIYIAVGQHVERAETIGVIGSTGNSTGPHLHFEIRKDNKVLDPLNYVRPPAEKAVKK